jgi:bacterioferritin-associated ferredoxin
MDLCDRRVVCHCLNVTEDVVVRAAADLGLRTLHEVRRHTGAGDGCTACHRRLSRLLDASALSPTLLSSAG